MDQDVIKSPIANNRWIDKFFSLLLVSIGIQNILTSTCGFLLYFKVLSIPHAFLEPEWQVQSSLVLAVAGSLYWGWKEKGGQISSATVHARLQEIIRFWLALSICNYGFSKIFGMQFSVPLHTSDTVVSLLNGMQLTWTYFSQSYALALIIGLCQVGGSILLLFRRTMLTGVLILLPVLINILLLNHFIGIPKEAYYNSVVYTGGLLYLLFLRRDVVKAILFKTTSELPPIKSVLIKSVGRAIAIGLPFAGIYAFWIAQPPVSPLRGKWRVDEFIKNGDTVTDNSWLTDNNVWKNIYIENFERMVLSPNPYVYEFDRAQEAKFKFDSSNRQIQVIIQTGWTVSDTMLVNISQHDNKKMQWHTVLRNDTLNLNLSRVSQ